jgi:6-phosphogluconolactonase
VGGERVPEFDLIVLGVGGDGHTGSLFPGSYASFDREDLACAVYVLDDDPNRITLTPPVLCAASRLIVLACGREKAEILKKILTSEPDEVQYPIHALWPALDKITWLVDADAAKSLEL